LLVDREIAPQFHNSGLELVVIDLGPRSIELQRLLEALTNFRAHRVETVIDALAPDVVLFPQQSIFPLHVHCKRVLVVHDLSHVHLRKHLSPLQRLFRAHIYDWSVRQADKIIAVSDTTRRAVLRRYGSWVKPHNVHVVYHGFRAGGAAGAARYPPPVAGEYLYYPAATLPHKNHLVLLRAIAQLQQTVGFPYRLVLSGIRTGYWRRLKREIRRLGLGNVVSHLGYVSFDQVGAIYGGAKAVLFPSVYEGFGLPVLEAVALGKKVIVSKLKLFREMGVPERFRIDFSSPEELLAALRLPGPTILEKSPWTWEQTARATLDVLRSTNRAARYVDSEMSPVITPHSERPSDITRAA
jgi:glycosyltransferase involved in cell wall biosynthesis